jgi:hypothetical protein
MSHKHKHSEAGRTRNERREHDRKVRTHDADVYAGPSKTARYALAGAAIIVVATLTILFMAGFIRW